MMNEFYDVCKEGQSIINPFQLDHLGARRNSYSFGTSTRNEYGERIYKSTSFDRNTIPKDYDLQFVNRIYKTNPPYNVDLLLNYHYDKYLEHNTNGHKIFLKHIKFVV